MFASPASESPELELEPELLDELALLELLELEPHAATATATAIAMSVSRNRRIKLTSSAEACSCPFPPPPHLHDGHDVACATGRAAHAASIPGSGTHGYSGLRVRRGDVRMKTTAVFGRADPELAQEDSAHGLGRAEAAGASNSSYRFAPLLQAPTGGL